MALVGYARVSSKGQNLDRQLEALKQAGVDKLFKESVSGKNVEDRIVFNNMMDYLREGDTLVVHSLDRLSRNYEDIKSIVQQLADIGVKLNSLNEEFINLDTGNESMNKFLTDTIIGLLAFVADNEREKIRERQREGIEIAKKKGAYANNGAETKYSPTGTEKEKYFAIIDDLKQERPIAHISKDRGVSRPTIYKIKDELQQQ